MNKTKKLNSPLIVLAILSSIMLIKLGVFRTLVYGEVSWLRLLFVDFPIWMLLPVLLFVVLRRVSPVVALIYNLIISALMVSIVLYERYFQTVPSYLDLQQGDQAGSVMGTVSLLYTPLDLLFFADILIYAALFVFYWNRPLTMKNRKKIGAAAFVLVVISAVTTTVAMQKPLLDMTLFAKEQGFVQTQVVQAMQQNSASAQMNLLSNEELAKLKGNEFVPFGEHERFGIAEDRHLFVIQVESLQNFAINQSIAGQELTPNINALLGDSLYFDRMFQQIGAGNTSDAEWLLHTSLLTRGLDPTVNYLNGTELPSLVGLLNDRDYYTTTYHADELKYWNREELYPALGFDYAYSLNEIPNEDVIHIGPSDRVMFQFAEEEIRQQIAEGKKIYANLMTMTSHTPFTMPEKDEYLELPESYEGSYTGDYLQSIRYADETIGEFIEFLKAEGIYEESIIVINGDHSGLHGTPMKVSDNNLMSELLGHQYSLKDRFLLPFIITAPGLFESEVNSNFGGQVDMMPTIMNLMGILPEAPMVGHNMLQYENNLLAVRYYLPGGSYITGDNMYLGQNARYPERYYDFDTMERIEIDKETIEKHQANSLKILDYSDALLSNYLDEDQQEESEEGS
jgi:lipoteichoic acid synthase